MNRDITYAARISFKGPIEEFQKVAAEIGKLGAHSGLMIDTQPMPDKPLDKRKTMMIDTVPLPERPISQLFIGTWPTPERPGDKLKTLMIETVPLPERPFPGIWPVARLGGKVHDELVEGMPRFKLLKDIYGGIRDPHLHIGNEIVLLNKRRFRKFVGEIAKGLSKDLREM